MTTEDKRIYYLKLRVSHDRQDPDGTQRLKRLLKYALRTCRIKCLAITEETTDGSEPNSDGP